MNNNFRNESIYSPEEGFTKGNLFPEMYTPYKNYVPKSVMPKDEKSKLLLEIDKYSFARHEINLYLDLNPNDSSMLQLFNDYREKENKLVNLYESKYGPLNITSDSLDNNPFLWEALAFPFEGGANNVGL